MSDLLRAGAVLLVVAVQPAPSLAIIPRAKLTPATLSAFDRFVREREDVFERRIAGNPFLWAEEKPERLRRLRRDGLVVEPLAADGAIGAGEGLIHDWLGAVFLPGATLDRTLALVQNYDAHKNHFAPEVMDSKLVRRQGDFFQVRLRLRKHKVITVVLDTDYDVTYRRLGRTRAVSRSYSARIAEIESPGTATERALPPGEDHGFLWRLHSFWRFEERDGGVCLEFEAISLTRGVPRLVAPIVNPIVHSLPRESVEATLRNLRQALARGPASD
ncbi:MAG: hypothetical protein HY822_23735 [Acidobacteria bacterium]|nr:hypothetical protein [Acidobacteriota bacterium]